VGADADARLEPVRAVDLVARTAANVEAAEASRASEPSSDMVQETQPSVDPTYKLVPVSWRPPQPLPSYPPHPYPLCPTPYPRR